MEMNIFRILGIQAREDAISNVLAYSFNTPPSFRDVFLESICEKDPKKYTKCEAHTRLSTTTSGVPDIVLACFYSKPVITEISDSIFTFKAVTIIMYDPFVFNQICLDVPKAVSFNSPLTYIR